MLAEDDGRQDRGQHAQRAGDVFSRDEDPELVRDAVPFALKLYESLLDSVPEPRAAARRHLQRLHAVRATRSSRPMRRARRRAPRGGAALRERALKLYLRGRGYCLRAMEVRWRGIGEQLLADPAPALARAERKDVAMLYWTAASWGAAISLGTRPAGTRGGLSRSCARWRNARWRSTRRGATARFTS